MSLPSVAADAQAIDWRVVAGAIGTFLVTCVTTYFGTRRGKRKIEENTHLSEDVVPLAVRGGVLMDNLSMLRLTEALNDQSRLTRELVDVIEKQLSTNHRLWETMAELRMDVRELQIALRNKS